MKIGDDADEIDLDLTLEKYDSAKMFLLKVLGKLAVSGSSVINFMTEGAVDRFVLASGGVARDFLAIFRKSVSAARERDGGYRGDRVSVEDVNVAAGEFDTTKREEFNAGSRKRRELNLIEFWKDSAKEDLRKSSLIYQGDIGSN